MPEADYTKAVALGEDWPDEAINAAAELSKRHYRHVGERQYAMETAISAAALISDRSQDMSGAVKLIWHRDMVIVVASNNAAKRIAELANTIIDEGSKNHERQKATHNIDR